MPVRLGQPALSPAPFLDGSNPVHGSAMPSTLSAQARAELQPSLRREEYDLLAPWLKESSPCSEGDGGLSDIIEHLLIAKPCTESLAYIISFIFPDDSERCILLAALLKR